MRKSNHFLKIGFFKIPISLLLVFICFISNLTYGQITRSQIINNAIPYSTFTWTAKSNNLWLGIPCGKRIVFYASNYVKVGTNTAMPYCWGGWSTIADHNSAMVAGKSAGDICSKAGSGCSKQGSFGAGIGCASGMDCSGFVSRAWALTSKYNVSLLNGISTKIDASQLKKGDILSMLKDPVNGDHVRLVTNTYSNGNIDVLEASGNGWKVALHTYSPVKLASYIPEKYNKVVEDCATPSNINATSITSNSAILNLNPVSNASIYLIAIKPSYSSVYAYYYSTITSTTITNLSPSTNYNYNIEAYCPVSGWSQYSATNTFRTNLSSPYCAQPLGVKITSLKSTSVVFNWLQTGAKSYTYLIKKNSEIGYTVWSNYTYNPVMFKDLTPNTTYSFAVSANCGNSNSVQSSVLTFTTPVSAANPLEKNNYKNNFNLPTPSDGKLLSNQESDSVEPSLLLYPNPIKAGQSLTLKSSFVITAVGLYSLDGKLVANFNFQASSQSIKIPENTSSSIYLLKIYSGKRLYTRKLVISNSNQ